MGIVVEKMALGLVFSKCFGFPILLASFYQCFLLIHNQCYMILAMKSVITFIKYRETKTEFTFGMYRLVRTVASHRSNGLFSQVTPYRAATAALVEKQSREMLELINEKRSEYMMAESLYLDEGDGYTEDVLLPYPSEAPIPAPPALSKFEVYNDPVEFADIDQIAISVRKADNLSDLQSAQCYWHEKHT